MIDFNQVEMLIQRHDKRMRDERAAAAIREAEMARAQFVCGPNRPIETNWDRRCREHRESVETADMFRECRALIAGLQDTTHSPAEHERCTKALAMLDARMGALS